MVVTIVDVYKRQEIDNMQDIDNHIFEIKPYKWAAGWSDGILMQVVDCLLYTSIDKQNDSSGNPYQICLSVHNNLRCQRQMKTISLKYKLFS